VTRLVALAVSLALGGCTAVGMVATSDPAEKLRQAATLFTQRPRPMLAEHLIQEALQTYTERNDELGRAEAYRIYGFFFRSPMLEKFADYYRERGFINTTARYDTRLEKSIEYFDRARTLLEARGRHDKLANVWLNTGFTYEFMKEPTRACEAYARSRAAYRAHMRAHPGAKVEVPPGWFGFEDYIGAVTQRVGCSPDAS
jgi:tetratricopeptide (TPR) repeat protein